jgi:hypothetical protein
MPAFCRWSPATFVTAAALAGALLAAAPGDARQKAPRVTAQAGLSGAGTLDVRGTVRPARAAWRVRVQVRRTRTRSGRSRVRWVNLTSSTRLGRGGRYRVGTLVRESRLVVRVVVLPGRRVIAKGKAVTVVAPRGANPSPSPPAPITPSPGAVASDGPPPGGSSGGGTVTPPPDPAIEPRSTLDPGERLTSGARLDSSNRRYRLVMQGDGNLVLYTGASALWSSGTQGERAYAVMQSDGNLVVYIDGTAAWSSRTAQFEGASLTLQDDGNLLVNQRGHPIWSRATGYVGDRLHAGWKLQPNAYLRSANRQYRLVMQGDGNLVLYKGAAALWSSKTKGSDARVVMQGDGNLVVYHGGAAKWSSRTGGHHGARLIVQNDGNLVIYDGPAAIWDPFRDDAASSGFRLPFPRNQTWDANGPHGDPGYTSTRYSVDLAPHGGGDGTVLAAAAGVARKSSTCSVDIDHSNGLTTRYQHLGVLTGGFPRSVAAGEQIGITKGTGVSGTSCNTTGFSHLHFGILSGGSPVPISGTSFGGYTVHAGSAAYQGSWTRDSDGAVVVPVASNGNATCCLVNNQPLPLFG